MNMCCDNSGACKADMTDKDSEVDCPDCGMPAILFDHGGRGGNSFEYVSSDICNYSPLICHTCGFAPCDYSC